MESAIRGLVLDSSVLVAAERAKLTTPEVLRNIRTAEVGDAPIVISVMTVAELAHGIYRANTPERRERRRQFVDELKTHVPVKRDRAVPYIGHDTRQNSKPTRSTPSH